ncbi:hypothetical protein [Moritella sp. F3]|uniref:hypothetical protein n=1 Tax=Moritella sp. F3 TaxID=2718882 RepID=UPI0018E1CEE7|nr:hypothetical protein [Moritella sp. F3]GIC77670.1 hypothetical protein FMO001_23970 [Moritella sp. F1]GIC82083.1 hypothetical protein FMO003_23640 [Moritella sp. F3]
MKKLVLTIALMLQPISSWANINIISFPSFGYTVELNNAKIVYLGESDDLCRDASLFNVKLGSSAEDVLDMCSSDTLGLHIGNLNNGQKVSYIYQSSKQSDAYSTTNANYEHELYHALKFSGSQEQIELFEQQISKLTNGVIDLGLYEEEQGAQVVSIISVYISGVDRESISPRDSFAKSVLDKLDDTVLNLDSVYNFKLSSDLRLLAKIVPSTVAVYSDLVSLHKCQADNPMRYIKNVLVGSELYTSYLTEYKTEYLVNLSNSFAPCISVG